jgi:tetratricopeptide (TPR) repeat protein
MLPDGKGDTPATPSDDSGMSRYTAGTPSADEPKTGSDPRTATNYDLSARPATPFAAGDTEETNYNAKASPRKDSTPPVAGRPPGEPGPPQGGDALPRRFGNYLLLEKIAEGGMGVVYKAQQLDPPRVVALKMILAGSFAAPSVMERFRVEARSVAVLDHPGIVPLYDFAEAEGKPYFTMAFVGGGSLQQLVKEGPLPARSAADIVLRIAEAVHYAHEKGVIHRDVKPSNILLQPREPHGPGDKPTSAAGTKGPGSDLSSLRAALPVPRLTDFGLARRQDDLSARTASGEILGTPSYMAPEQAEGNPDTIGPATDVYGLGAVLYCLLTGRPPFQASSPLETLRQVREHEPVAPGRLNATVPRDLETICLKCLSKDPARRYASARLLADDLGRYLAGVPVLARPVGSFGKFVRWCRRYPAVAGLTGAVAAGLILVTAFSLYFAVKWEQKVEEANESKWEARRSELMAQREKENADAERDKAKDEAHKSSWIQDLLVARAGDPLGIETSVVFFDREVGQKREITKLLELAEFKADNDSDLKSNPMLRAAVKHSVARAYCTLGIRDKAVKLLLAAIPLCEGADDARARQEAAEAKVDLGQLFEEQGRYEDSLKLFAEALQVLEADPVVNDETITRILRSEGWIAMHFEDFAKAENIFRVALKRANTSLSSAGDVRRVHEARKTVIAVSMGLTGLYIDQGKYQDAIPQAMSALASIVKDEESKQLAPAFEQAKKAVLMFGLKQYASAEQSAKNMLAVMPTAPGGEPFYYECMVLYFLALTQEAQGPARYDDAIKTYEKCLHSLRQSVGYKLDMASLPLASYANVLHKVNPADDAADKEFLKFLAAQEERFGPTHVCYANALVRYVKSLEERSAQGPVREKFASQARQIYESSVKSHWRGYRECLKSLSAVYRERGDTQKAAEIDLLLAKLQRADPQPAGPVK